MKKLNLLLFITLLLLVTGCKDKKTEQPSEENRSIQTKNEQVTEATEVLKEMAELRQKDTFIISDTNDINHSVILENKHIEISDISQNIIMLNFFATWCPPCKGEIPYLADLQKKYKGKLFIAGLLVNDPIDTDGLKTFISKYGINYSVFKADDNDTFVKFAASRLQLEKNFPIPLTVVFKNGSYYSHYEGAVPVEMLEHDIKNAMHKE